MLNLGRLVAISVLFFAASHNARATIDNRNVFPFGEREAFLGNAGTAGGPSSAAVYYNPARLLLLEHDQIAVSGSTYVSLTTQADRFAVVGATSLPYQDSGFSTIPSTVISTFKPNDRLAFAYFILVPELFSISNRQTLTTPTSNLTLTQVQSSQDLWVGGSVAMRLDSHWTMGFSLFGVQHSDLASINVVAPVPGTPNTIIFSDKYLQASVYGFSALGGLLYKPSERFQVGLRVQAPLVQVSGSGNGYQTDQNVTSGVLNGTEYNPTSLSASYAIPLDVSLGGRWVLQPGWNLVADLGLQLGTQFDPYPGSVFSDPVEYSSTLRANAGTEVELSSRFVLSGGLFYNPSALHNLNYSEEGQGKVDIWAGTLGILYRSERIKTGVGGFYLTGSGDLVTISGGGTTGAFRRRAVGGLLSVSYYL